VVVVPGSEATWALLVPMIEVKMHAAYSKLKRGDGNKSMK
jgi:hypothetical protein